MQLHGNGKLITGVVQASNFRLYLWQRQAVMLAWKPHMSAYQLKLRRLLRVLVLSTD